MEKEKNIFYNLIRKEVIKKITCGLGEVSETDDAIVCYVDKSKIAKEKDEYVIDCYGYNGTNLDLAKKYNTTVNSIAKKNNIKDVNKIYIGQVLKI